MVFGREVTIKNLRKGTVKEVFLAKNCPEKIKKEIKNYDVKIIELEIPSDELALICKRLHPISVLSC